MTAVLPIAEPLMPAEAFEAREQQHRRDIAAKDMEIMLLRQQVLELGGQPVMETGAEFVEMYRACANVIRAAHECVANLGTSVELLRVFR